MKEEPKTPLEALKALVIKLKQIEANPDYQAIWALMDSHGLKYKGPNWEKELKQAQVLLTDWEETQP